MTDNEKKCILTLLIGKEREIYSTNHSISHPTEEGVGRGDKDISEEIVNGKNNDLTL